MLEVRDLHAWYGPVHAVRAAHFQVAPGEIVAIVGANGAGKTTLARCIMGLHPSREGLVRVDDTDLSTATPVKAARNGLALVPQGRRLFGSLTVEEHLRLAARQSRSDCFAVDDVTRFFPRLTERSNQRARLLSGGEQQMLAIARAVLQGPTYVLLDEPTEGLAPIMVSAVERLIDEMPRRGVGVVLIEQAGNPMVGKSDRLLTMSRGEVELSRQDHRTSGSAPSSSLNQGDSS